MSSEIKKQLAKECSVYGKQFRLFVYDGGKYCGGRYFGKIPLFQKKEWNTARRMGTFKRRIGDIVVDVLKKNPKPYAYAEYWECSASHWKY